MSAMAGLAFVLHLWFLLHKGNGGGKWCFILLLASPYILLLCFSVAMVVLGSLYPETVSRSRYLFYCTINLRIVNIVPAASAIIMCVLLVFEVLIGIKLYRHNKSFKTMNRTGNSVGPPLQLFVRVGIFSGYSLLALVACISFWSSTGDDIPYFIQASLPTAAFLIFGTQGDLLRACGVTAAVAFISRPFSHFLPSTEPSRSKATPVVLPTEDSRREDIPPAVPEKDTVLHITVQNEVHIV